MKDPSEKRKNSDLSASERILLLFETQHPLIDIFFLYVVKIDRGISRLFKTEMWMFRRVCWGQQKNRWTCSHFLFFQLTGRPAFEVGGQRPLARPLPCGLPLPWGQRESPHQVDAHGGHWTEEILKGFGCGNYSSDSYFYSKWDPVSHFFLLFFYKKSSSCI